MMSQIRVVGSDGAIRNAAGSYGVGFCILPAGKFPGGFPFDVVFKGGPLIGQRLPVSAMGNLIFGNTKMFDNFDIENAHPGSYYRIFTFHRPEERINLAGKTKWTETIYTPGYVNAITPTFDPDSADSGFWVSPYAVSWTAVFYGGLGAGGVPTDDYRVGLYVQSQYGLNGSGDPQWYYGEDVLSAADGTAAVTAAASSNSEGGTIGVFVTREVLVPGGRMAFVQEEAGDGQTTMELHMTYEF